MVKDFLRPWSWPRAPVTNELEFEQLMNDVDCYLYEHGFEPMQRPSVFPGKLNEAFGGVIHVYPDDALADAPGFTGDVLVAKGHRWYQQMYGDRLIADWKIGFVLVELGCALWKIRIPQVYGNCEYFADRNLSNIGMNGEGRPLERYAMVMSAEHTAKLNLLTLVEGMTQGMASRLSDERIAELCKFMETSLRAMHWLVGLFWRVQHSDERLFYTAYLDFQASVDSMLNRRYNQAKWDISQCAEKVMKGILQIKYEEFARTHNLSKLLNGFPVNDTLSYQPLLNEIYCDSKVRYSEEDVTREGAIQSSIAILQFLVKLSTEKEIAKTLKADSKNRK